MKKDKILPIIVILILVSILFLFPKEKTESKISIFQGMPCHEMSGGMLMGNCDEELMEDAMKVGMMQSTNDGFLPEYEINKIPKSQTSKITELKDGDKFYISADVVGHTINGKDYAMYSYNHQIPGPIIKVEKGTSIIVEFKNNIDQDSTIHWHGLRHSNKNDGVPGITQEPVRPGGSFTYEVYFPDEGVFWYHPHIREELEQDLGLAGNILVYKKDKKHKVNKEEVLILDDILIEEGTIARYGKESAEFALMGRFGNTMLINGVTDYNLNVNQGDVVRFYLTNVANVRPFNVVFEGAKMKLVGGDLGMYEKEKFVDSILISPAERYIVDVYFEDEGNYKIKNENPERIYTLGEIIANHKNSQDDYSIDFNMLKENSEVTKDIKQFEKYFDKKPDYEIDLDVKMNMMHNMRMMEEEHEIEWEDSMPTMNRMMTSDDVMWIMRDRNTKKENMEIDMNAKKGDVLKIRIFNDPKSAHPMQHPIHIHGQRFLVIEDNGIKNDNFVWKDTVLIPKGHTVDLLVDVTNPGEWMMHCHIAEHLEAGMMASLIVG